MQQLRLRFTIIPAFLHRLSVRRQPGSGLDGNMVLASTRHQLTARTICVLAGGTLCNKTHQALSDEHNTQINEQILAIFEVYESRQLMN